MSIALGCTGGVLFRYEATRPQELLVLFLFLFLIFLICFHIFIWRSSIFSLLYLASMCVCVWGWKRTSCVLPSVSASSPWYRLSHRAWSKLWWSPSLQLPTPRAPGLQTQLLLAFYMDAGTHIPALTLNVLLPTESMHTLTHTFLQDYFEATIHICYK